MKRIPLWQNLPAYETFVLNSRRKKWGLRRMCNHIIEQLPSIDEIVILNFVTRILRENGKPYIISEVRIALSAFYDKQYHHPSQRKALIESAFKNKQALLRLKLMKNAPGREKTEKRYGESK